MRGLFTAAGRVAPRILKLTPLLVPIALTLVLARPTPSWVSAGFAVAMVGEGLRLWASGHLVKNEELVTSGPYRFTRNPLYLGRLLIFTGLCVMAPLPYYANAIVLGAGYAFFFGVYLPRKERVEPERLARIHGDAYRRYREAVPVLLPFSRPYPEQAASGWSSERMLRNREHWMLAALVLISLLLLWRAYSLQEPTADLGAAPAEKESR